MASKFGKLHDIVNLTNEIGQKVREVAAMVYNVRNALPAIQSGELTVAMLAKRLQEAEDILNKLAV